MIHNSEVKDVSTLMLIISRNPNRTPIVHTVWWFIRPVVQLSFTLEVNRNFNNETAFFIIYKWKPKKLGTDFWKFIISELVSWSLYIRHILCLILFSVSWTIDHRRGSAPSRALKKRAPWHWFTADRNLCFSLLFIFADYRLIVCYQEPEKTDIFYRILLYKYTQRAKRLLWMLATLHNKKCL